MTTTRRPASRPNARKKAEDPEQAKALKNLKEWLSPDMRIFYIVRKNSDMSRVVDFYLFRPDKKAPGGVAKDWLSYNMAKALGMSMHPKVTGIVVRGTGMDMGWHTVTKLAKKLFDDEQALKAEQL